jgi:HEAT repeat protein
MGILNRLFGSLSREKLNKKEIKVSIKALESGHPGAKEALVKIGRAAVEPLIAALKNRISVGAQCRIIITLGELRDVRALEPLIALLEDADEHPQTRYYASQALGQLRDSRAVKPLIDAAMDEQTYFIDTTDCRLYLHYAAEEALMNIVGRDIVEPSVGPLLAAYLKDESWSIRQHAAWMLGEIRDVRAVEALVMCLDDPDFHVCSSAKDALVKIGKPAVDPLVACLKAGNSFGGYTNSYYAAMALIEIGRPAADVLETCLKAGNLRVQELITKAALRSGMRESALSALVKIKDTSVMAQLMALTGSKDWAQSTVMGLEYLLTHFPVDATLAELKTLVQLDDVIQETRSYAYGRCVQVNRYPVDCSALRQLARQELIRRGTGKVKKCLACGTEIPSGGLECPACGSARFIWE